MDNLVIFSFFRKTISVLHWIFYGFWIFIVILHAEIWFYGIKFNGDLAIIIHFTLGIIGILLGFFILKQKKMAYFGSLSLFVVMIGSVLTNHIIS